MSLFGLHFWKIFSLHINYFWQVFIPFIPFKDIIPLSSSLHCQWWEDSYHFYPIPLYEMCLFTLDIFKGHLSLSPSPASAICLWYVYLLCSLYSYCLGFAEYLGFLCLCFHICYLILESFRHCFVSLNISMDSLFLLFFFYRFQL